jgi:hypothetical protein
MSRKLRIEYPGAMYHVMNQWGSARGYLPGRPTDHRQFLSTLGEACGKTERQVHAYCLRRNHFHLVLVQTVQVLTIDTTTARFGRHRFRSLPFPRGRGKDVLMLSPS